MGLPLTYPSVTNLLVAWWPTVVDRLTVKVRPTSISTALPPEYRKSLPFVRLRRAGGTRSLGLDYASMTVEVFALSYDDAETLANEFSSLVEWGLHGFSDGEGAVLTAETVNAPTQTPWDDQNVTRFIATYRITVGALH